MSAHIMRPNTVRYIGNTATPYVKCGTAARIESAYPTTKNDHVVMSSLDGSFHVFLIVGRYASMSPMRLSESANAALRYTIYVRIETNDKARQM